ncbi:CmpA/NrtA family ABC transporter substrate-binding protein [Aliiroseovarius sp. PTFE2010]|uniref:CmpA/NrtA family ABC transporter substrate-binding protein n=1 Tax=Aliiroseovarius sp. PTFE2010 TaxID=3417190 RepID=UPI003CEDE6CA
MRLRSLRAGFIPLVDAAPLVIARELRFAQQEGLDLQLIKAPSWATLRDMLVFGQIDAAHMLAPVPIAIAMGLGGMPVRLEALMVLSVGGNVVGVSRTLAARMREAGHPFDFADATTAGQALITATQGRLRIGVPFPFSMHAELLYYWLNALGLSAPQSLDVKTIPPQMMASAMASGDIDAFCVGAPWGSIAVEQGVGELLLPTSAIWKFAPEKVLAVRRDWAGAEPDTAGALMRAVWRAGRWLSNPGNHSTAAELLARSDYVDVSAEIVERALSGTLTISPKGDLRHAPAFLEFHAGAAMFPWRSQAAWIAARLASHTGLDRSAAMADAANVFRPDLYRLHLGPAGADLPGASEKLEGALSERTPVASASGRMILEPDSFFDGTVFDLASRE